MLTREQKQFFEEQGYLLVPNVLSTETIRKLRNRITEIFESGEWKKSPYNTHNGLAGVYDEFPELIPDILNPTVIEVLRDLLETTPVLIPEAAIHYKFYTGWHKDTTTQEKQGIDFHWKPGGTLLQCGYYLQDNDDLGGGLTVMPGSHKTPDPFSKPRKPLGYMDRLKRKLGLYSEEKDKTINPHGHAIVDIPSKAGDFVIFNMKTNHRATLPKSVSTENIPKEKQKIAIFNAFASDNFYADEYLNFLLSRPEPFYDYLRLNQRPQTLVTHSQNFNFKIS